MRLNEKKSKTLITQRCCCSPKAKLIFMKFVIKALEGAHWKTKLLKKSPFTLINCIKFFIFLLRSAIAFRLTEWVRTWTYTQYTQANERVGCARSSLSDGQMKSFFSSSSSLFQAWLPSLIKFDIRRVFLFWRKSLYKKCKEVIWRLTQGQRASIIYFFFCDRWKLLKKCKLYEWFSSIAVFL